MIRFPDHFPHDNFVKEGRKFGRLTGEVEFSVPVLGYEADLCDLFESKPLLGKPVKLWVHAKLYKTGRLIVRNTSEWDYGSGPAIDTPDVVRASLPHDVLCHLTNARKIPWKFRSVADQVYREALNYYGASLPRRWIQWAGVRLYSECVARWRDKK